MNTATLAVLAGDIMNWGIVLAAIAMAAGLVVIYATRAHSLMMEKPPNDADKKSSDDDV